VVSVLIYLHSGTHVLYASIWTYLLYSYNYGCYLEATVTYMIPYVVAVVSLSLPISQTSVVLQLTCNQQKRHLLTTWLTLKIALGLLRPKTKENQKLTNLCIYLWFILTILSVFLAIQCRKIGSWTERIGEVVEGSWPGPVQSTLTIPQRAYKDRRKPRKVSFGIAEATTEILTRHKRNTSQNRYRVSQFTGRS
jgi:hypothetical protein